MAEPLDERLQAAIDEFQALAGDAPPQDAVTAANKVAALAVEALTWSQHALAITAEVQMGDGFRPYGTIAAAELDEGGCTVGVTRVTVYESLSEPGVVVVDVDGDTSTHGGHAWAPKIVLNDAALWDPVEGRRPPMCELDDEPTWPMTIRRKNAPDDTIWACCVSTIGPVCEHQTFPAEEVKA